MTTTAPDRQPSTPGQALRWAADNCVPESLYRLRDTLRRWAAELDAAPARPSGGLPPGIAWHLMTWHCTRCGKSGTWTTAGGAIDPLAEAHAEAFGHHVNHLQWDAGPLSTAPPAGTEGT